MSYNNHWVGQLKWVWLYQNPIPCINHNWHFPPLLLFGSDFVSWFFYQKVLNFFGSKNWHQSGYFDTLSSLLSLIKVALRSSKDEHFTCFHMSCQTGLMIHSKFKLKQKKINVMTLLCTFTSFSPPYVISSTCIKTPILFGISYFVSGYYLDLSTFCSLSFSSVPSYHYGRWFWYSKKKSCFFFLYKFMIKNIFHLHQTILRMILICESVF